MKKTKILSIVLGGTLFLFGGYLVVTQKMVEKELSGLRQGAASISKIVELVRFPFVRKDVVAYDAYLYQIKSGGEMPSILEGLHRLLQESTNPEIQFRTSLLLGHIYSSRLSGKDAEKTLPIAVEMHIRALKIKPDDRFAKLALEKLFDQANTHSSKEVKKRIKQGKPKEKGKKWLTKDKGDEI